MRANSYVDLSEIFIVSSDGSRQFFSAESAVDKYVTHTSTK